MVAARSIVVLRTLAAACVMLIRNAMGASVQRKPFGLEESVSGDFVPSTLPLEWINGTKLLLQYDGEMVAIDSITGDQTVLLPNEIVEEFSPIKTSLSPNERFVLLGYDAEEVFRHVPIARYVAYNIEEKTATEIDGGERLQVAEWGFGNQIVYIYQNNIYYLSEPGAEPVQVTTDGVPGLIYNGVASEYEESVVGQYEMPMWPSPCGGKLAFVQYNVSLVHNASIIFYGEPGDLEHQYATAVTFRYSKVGTPKAKQLLKVASLSTDGTTSVTIQDLLVPVDVVGEDNYIGGMDWTDDDSLLVSWSNRARNVTQDVTYSTSENKEQIVGRKGLKRENKNGWLDSIPFMFRADNRETYLAIDWQPQGEAGSFPHAVTVTGTTKKAITSGEMTVTEIYGWADNGTVYYQATEEGQPSRRQVYAVEEGGVPRCLSCDVISPEGNRCRRASASFSWDLSRYLLTCHGPDPPVTLLRSATNPAGKSAVLEGNKELRKMLRTKQRPTVVDDWVDLGDGARAQVRLLLPPGLDPKGSEKRPTVVHVYGGPESQQVDDSFRVDINSFFTTSRRYVCVLIDGRGSDCKGDRMLFAAYRRFGTVEVQDQISVTKRLAEKYRFIDASRIGVWGWSYGGYTAAMVLAQDQEDVFKCGVSVAPVTSWIYTDSLYTEQFMGLPTPEDNEAGYNASDVTRLAERFANKTFMLMHGTADDTTFYQNSMMLVRALVEAGVLFRQQSYPDESHSIDDLDVHVYRTMDEFFEECFEERSSSFGFKIIGALMVMMSLAVYVL